MRIERLTSNKIKITLTKHDLQYFDIDINKLAFSPEKAEEIFRDMMSIAEIEAGFVSYDSQLIIEARPNFGENKDFVMFVTKVEEKDDIENIKKLIKTGKIKAKKKETINTICSLVYKFDSFDDATIGLVKLPVNITTESSFAKYDGLYFISMSAEKINQKAIELTLCEYAKRVYTPNFLAVLHEYGEILIEKNAIEKITSSF